MCLRPGIYPPGASPEPLKASPAPRLLLRIHLLHIQDLRQLLQLITWTKSAVSSGAGNPVISAPFLPCEALRRRITLQMLQACVPPSWFPEDLRQLITWYRIRIQAEDPPAECLKASPAPRQLLRIPEKWLFPPHFPFYVYFPQFLLFFCLKGSELIIFHGNRPPLLLEMSCAAKA